MSRALQRSLLFCLCRCVRQLSLVSRFSVVSPLPLPLILTFCLRHCRLLPLMLFGGLLVNIDTIPPYFYWLSYLSFFR